IPFFSFHPDVSLRALHSFPTRRSSDLILLFIDNIFRFTQAGSEVSALLGRMPSAVGYQPTLATEMGDLQERITSTKSGSITSVRSEEHTSELQSRFDLVCRLLLEKKKK